jgi:hypothetical protein
MQLFSLTWILCDIASGICHLAQAIKGDERSAIEEVKHILEMVFVLLLSKYIILYLLSFHCKGHLIFFLFNFFLCCRKGNGYYLDLWS